MMDEYKSLKKFQKENKSNSSLKCSVFRFLTEVMLSVVLLLVALILSKNTSMKEMIYKYVYQDNLSFKQIESVYQKYFGLLVPSLKEEGTEVVSSEKLVYESIEELDGGGVRLKFNDDEQFQALMDGLVLFVGEKEGYGKVLVLEQTDGVEAWYVNIDFSDFKIYDYIKKGEVIGTTKENYVDLYFKKKGEVISYQDYIY